MGEAASPFCDVKFKIAPDTVSPENGLQGLKNVFPGISFRTQVAQHDRLGTRRTLLPDVIEEPCRFFILHVKTAVVVGVLPQELGIMIGFKKDEIGIDALFDKPLPVIKVRHDDHLSTDTVLAAVDHEPEVVAVGLMGNRNRAEEKFPHSKRLVGEGADLWKRMSDCSREQILQLFYATLMTPNQRTVFPQNPQGGSADMILVDVGHDNRFDPARVANMFLDQFVTFGLGGDPAVDQNSGPPCPEHQTISTAPGTDRFEVKRHDQGR